MFCIFITSMAEYRSGLVTFDQVLHPFLRLICRAIFFRGMYLQALKGVGVLWLIFLVQIQRVDMPKSIRDVTNVCQKNHRVSNNHFSKLMSQLVVICK